MTVTKAICSFHFLALLATPSFAQTADSIWDEERLSDATVCLLQPVSDSTRKVGSGTIMRNGTSYFLLTATHVAMTTTNATLLVLRLDGDTPRMVDLTRVVDGGVLNWLHHAVADISLIRLAPKDSDVKDRVAKVAFPFSQVYYRHDLPGRDVDLTFLGYSVIDLNVKHFSPLVFSAHRSSGLLTQPRADTHTPCDFFFLDVPGIGGCSGSGVFSSVEKKVYVGCGATRMEGIVHGTMSDITGGKMAVVTPAPYIADFFRK